jgi:hypothetical protein
VTKRKRATYLADAEDIFKDRAISLHHHDVLGNVHIEKLFGFHLAGFDNDDDLSLDLVQGGNVSGESDSVSAHGIDEEVGLVEVAPKLF